MYIGYYKSNKVNIKIEASETEITEITDISFLQNNSEAEEQEKANQVMEL